MLMAYVRNSSEEFFWILDSFNTAQLLSLEARLQKSDSSKLAGKCLKVVFNFAKHVHSFLLNLFLVKFVLNIFVISFHILLFVGYPVCV